MRNARAQNCGDKAAQPTKNFSRKHQILPLNTANINPVYTILRSTATMSRQLDTNQDVIDTKGGKGCDPRDLLDEKAIRTVESVTIPKEVFDRHYTIQPEPRAVVRSVFGNPFPM